MSIARWKKFHFRFLCAVLLSLFPLFLGFGGCLVCWAGTPCDVGTPVGAEAEPDQERGFLNCLQPSGGLPG